MDGATNMDDYLRLRVYAIDYLKNARGRTSPFLTLVAYGYPGDVGKGISENMRYVTSELFFLFQDSDQVSTHKYA